MLFFNCYCLPSIVYHLNKRRISALVQLANVNSEHLGMISDLDLEKNYNFKPFFEKF